MKYRLAATILVFSLLGLLAPIAVFTQEQSAARRQFETAVAIVDPGERITALETFLGRNRDADLALAAREEIVRSRAEMAERRLGENDIKGALALLRQAIANLPEKVSDRFFEATVARIPFAVSARGYRAEAIELAGVLESRFAREPLRLGALGEFYLNLEAPHEAVRALEAATRLAREEVKLRRPLAAAYRMGLRLDDAEKELQQVAALDGSDRRAYAELGNLARARGDYTEAARLYRSQLRIDAENLAALEGLALVELAQGRETEAAAALDRIRKLKGAEAVDTNLHLQTQLGFYFLAQGKYPQANLAIVQAIAREPRYSWARLAAAELDLAEGRYFEAENHLLAALKNADFPTLRFTLGKLYLAVEDFNGAIEQFGRAFVLARSGKFAARLGGVLPFEADRLKDLLARERQASIFIARPPTTDEQFALAETLVRLDAQLPALNAGASGSPEASAGTSSGGATRRAGGRIARGGEGELEEAGNAFINAEGQRRAFRALYVAQRLAQAGQSHPYAQKLVDLVLELSEAATAANGSLLEYPNYDREGRYRILRGRALDARGWSHFQQRRNREAIAALQEAVEAYGGLPEGRSAMWRLATVRETVGEAKEALDIYLAAYEPPADPTATDVKRSVIEVLYRKVHGSLDGFEARLGKTTGTVAEAPPAEEKPPARSGRRVDSRGDSRGETKDELKARPKRVAADLQANLPEVAPVQPALASSRVPASVRASRTLFPIRPVSPPPPGKLGETGVSDPIRIAVKEDVKLAVGRINPRLLRWPYEAETEKAPAPGSVPAAESAEGQTAPGGRPRRVPAEAPSRSRRVKTPQ